MISNNNGSSNQSMMNQTSSAVQEDKWDRIVVRRKTFSAHSKQTVRNGVKEKLSAFYSSESESEEVEEARQQKLTKFNGAVSRVSHFSETEDEGEGLQRVKGFGSKVWTMGKRVTSSVGVWFYWALVNSFVCEKWILNRKPGQESPFFVPVHRCSSLALRPVARRTSGGPVMSTQGSALPWSRSATYFLIPLLAAAGVYLAATTIGLNSFKPKDFFAGFLKESSTDFSKESPNNFVKESSTDFVKESTTGFVKESTTDFVKESTTDFVKESSSHVTKDYTKECTIVCPPPPVVAPVPTQCGISGGDVELMIRAAIAQYDADKTGKPDLALESAGGSIVSTRCTKKSNYIGSQVLIWNIPIWYPSNNPRKAIQPGAMPGDCWSFDGSEGFLVIKLVGPTRVTGFTMEHLAKAISPHGHIQSAPKRFQVVGHLDYTDSEKEFVLGEYEYLDNDIPMQYFEVQNQSDTFFPFVELKILSNHGSIAFTCLYRFRVHGYLESWAHLKE